MYICIYVYSGEVGVIYIYIYIYKSGFELSLAWFVAHLVKKTEFRSSHNPREQQLFPRALRFDRAVNR